MKYQKALGDSATKSGRMDDIPLILETIDESIWAKEIETLYSFVEDSSITK